MKVDAITLSNSLHRLKQLLSDDVDINNPEMILYYLSLKNLQEKPRQTISKWQ